jgi:predicted metal-dependent hydrolase
LDKVSTLVDSIFSVLQRTGEAGNLNFSDDLLALDRELTDYVIVHELLHFYVPNHGKLWKSLMRAHLGDYERAESKLKSKVATLSGRARD